MKDIVVFCYHDLFKPFVCHLVNSHTSSLGYLLNSCLQPLALLVDELALMVLSFQSKNELRPTEITIVSVARWCSSADARFYFPFGLNLKGRSVTYAFRTPSAYAVWREKQIAIFVVDGGYFCKRGRALSYSVHIVIKVTYIAHISELFFMPLPW